MATEIDNNAGAVVMDERNVSRMLLGAAEAQRAGLRAAAIAGYRAVLTAVPEHPIALNALAADALGSGDLQAATLFFKRAVAADPLSPDLLANLAHVQALTGDVIGAGDSLQKSIKLAPEAIGPRIRMAQWQEKAGTAGAAADAWRTVIGLVQGGQPIPPQIQPFIDHARKFIADQSRILARDVDQALEILRTGMPARETRRVDAGIDYTLGRRGIYLNQCTGLHIPFLPADEFFDAALFPWFEELESATSTIVAELDADLRAEGGTPAGFTPYIDLPTGIRSDQWDALDKSSDWSALHFWRDGVRDEAVCRRFPVTAAILERLPLAHLPNRMPTIFLSALQPHTHIPPHTGVTNARAIVHLPLIVPDGCRLRVGGEVRTWDVGKAFAFDDTIEHEAWNDGDGLRIVLIMDAWNPHLTEMERKMIDAFYQASEASAVAPNHEERARLA